jgi:hypothetical protein
LHYRALSRTGPGGNSSRHDNARAPIASSLAANSNDPAFGSVRVEFRGRTADGVLVEERSLTFSPARQSECPASGET